MGAYAAGSTHHNIEFGLSAGLRLCKRILNGVAERASIASDRSRFAALPSRYLEDIGMTEAERAAILLYAEPAIDGWRVVASHL
ncbi:MAG TPA: hypothetical protein VFE63_04135 [Roseiarcus sp.]|jgi:hypothetical protein|nr:hypothetical protein [Roseiarcus sp.]